MARSSRQPRSYGELVEVLDELPVAFRHERRRRGVTLHQAAGECGLDHTTLSRFERGMVDPTAATVRAVLVWLDNGGPPPAPAAVRLEAT